MATDVPFMAGAIAYQALVSLLPLLFLLVVATATVGGEGLTNRLLDITAGQLPADSHELVTEAVRAALAQTGNSIVGVAVLGFGAFAVFNGFDKAFTDLYGVDRGRTLPNQLRDAAVVFVVMAAAVIAMAVAWWMVPRPGRIPFGGVFQSVALAVGLAVAFCPMFYVFPEVDLDWRDVLPGVAVAAVGVTGLQALFQLYVRFAARSDAFGAVGGALLLATWLYFGGFALLLGATLNAVLYDSTEERAAEDGAVRGPGLADE